MNPESITPPTPSTPTAQPSAAPPEPKPSADGIFRRGFGLKGDISADLADDYHSQLVEELRSGGNRMTRGDIEIRLAKEFGFCYGVDKAVDFAYEARRNFPDRRIFLTAEIIHNPRVNRRLMEMGIEFLSGQYAKGTTLAGVGPGDVVVLPAFGVSIGELEQLQATGCVLVDTTCGSVIHVWKRVEKYARDGFTSLIHGKAEHEETIATASYASHGGRGRHVVVRDKAEAELICDFIRTGEGGEALTKKFADAASDGFEFERDLGRIGVANQTTMLSSESLEIGAMVREAMAERYGADAADAHFRSFDTICHATQERQDAVAEMMSEPPGLMIVIGGFNSSNTGHLSEIASEHCPTYHIEDLECMISRDRIRHKPPEPGAEPTKTERWYPETRPLVIGVTAGASTPNRVVGEVIALLLEWGEGEGEA